MQRGIWRQFFANALFSAATATLLMSPLTAVAIVVNLDAFTVERNGAIFFNDSFDDGLAPPSAPNFPNGQSASYNVFGAFSSESGGRLRLASADGGLTFNAIEQSRRTLRSVLVTNVDSANLVSGLKVDDTLSVSAIYDLATPTGPLINGYSVRFSDRDAGGVKQTADLQVVWRPEGGALVRSLHQDFEANCVCVLDSDSLAAPAGADQIRLTITRPDAGAANFFASWSYLANGAVVGGGASATPAVLFQGENFVRAEFLAFEAVNAPIPEVSTGWLTLAGLLVAGFAARRARGGSAG
jgi:hypothetical protein